MEGNLPAADQVEWNLSAALVAEIQTLLLKATAAYNKGGIPQAFYFMKSIKFRFVQSLDKDERKKLRSIEGIFSKIKRGYLKIGSYNSKDSLSIVYERYNIEIMDLLQLYGYLIPLKKDSTRIS